MLIAGLSKQRCRSTKSIKLAEQQVSNETFQLEQSDAIQTILKRQYFWTASANVGKLPILPVSKASNAIRAASKLVGTVAQYWDFNIVCIEGSCCCCVGITLFWWAVLQLTVGASQAPTWNKSILGPAGMKLHPRSVIRNPHFAWQTHFLYFAEPTEPCIIS